MSLDIRPGVATWINDEALRRGYKSCVVSRSAITDRILVTVTYRPNGFAGLYYACLLFDCELFYLSLGQWTSAVSREFDMLDKKTMITKKNRLQEGPADGSWGECGY